MLCTSNAFRQLNEYSELLKSAKQNRFPAVLTGLSHIHKAVLIQTLCRDLNRRAIIVMPDEADGIKLKSDLEQLGLKVGLLPARDLILHDVAGVSREYEHVRIGVLSDILDGCYDAVICSAEAALMLTIPPETLKSNRFVLSQGDSISPAEIAERLVACGYARSDMVEGAGQFALRGDILDVFTPNMPQPIRIEFWGDEIDTISSFDSLTQRRGESVKAVTITPAAEVLTGNSAEFSEKLQAFIQKLGKKSSAARQKLTDIALSVSGGMMPASPDRFLPLVYKPATVFDYTQDHLLFVSESAKIKERCKAYTTLLNNEIKGLFESGILCEGLDKFSINYSDLTSVLEARDTIITDSFARGSYDISTKQLINFTLRQLSVWNGSLEQLKEDAVPLLEKGYAVSVLVGNESAALSLVNELQQSSINAVFSASADELVHNTISVSEGSLSSGIDLPAAKFALISHCAAVKKKKSRYKKNKNAISSLDDLHNGDYVVHVSHGIGIFDGIRSMTVQGVTKDYIKIRYAKQDVLYVPVTQLDLVSRYIGNADTSSVKLNRLGGSDWNKTRSSVKTAVREMAKELIKLYAERVSKPGFAFGEDTDLQSDFEQRFEYEETEDQLRSINEIKRDMERSAPMDRLLCGDVGFGKTEVALRAAFKCVCDSKQCAILVPTTILALQHYQTIVRRMEGLPVTIEVLSRFRTPKQQKNILSRLKSGEIDIIIGTHKLLSSSIAFRDLGLLIVDEEQRFGVSQKEKLRQAYPNVDTLTLSATPIPRTLNMAMSGLRDMSSIDEAPSDRYPVQTYVMEYEKSIVLDAIRRELRRGGQVYYLHNRVDNIDIRAAALAAELPDARIAVAHGKMTEEQLSEVWRQLVDGEVDILLCTTIIETGVDVPNANTLIIEDADHMGLAQLHQLRGRIGRSNRRAYAYLTFRQGKALSEVAQKRLEAIREFTEFGSGFKIAMRDLEIRGAGNILGGEQHGHMNSVGYDMYIRLLNDAISEEKGEKPKASYNECTIDIQIGAHIPEAYIPSLTARLGIYRRIADIRNADDVRDVIDELIDRFGEPPKSVQGLIEISLLRNRCAAVGILKVEQQDCFVRIFPDVIDTRYVAALSAELGRLFRLNAGAKPYYEIRLLGTITPIEVLEGAVSVIEKSIS